MAYPNWVLKHKAPSTNISFIRGKYYLYSVSSIWDKEKHRARKITHEYLGRITEEGLIPPSRRLSKPITLVTVKEFGSVSLLETVSKDILDNLRELYPKQAEQLYVLAMLRVIHHCPLKRIEHFYEQSYISEIFGNLKLSSPSLTSFLRSIGAQREKISKFMEHFIGGNKYLLFDATNIISKSEKMDINRLGYKRQTGFNAQVNLLYAFALDNKMPVYYRILPGNIKDVTALKLTVEEAQLKDIIVVADKGFGSTANFEMLDKAGLNYIIPLRRNSSLFDKGIIRAGDKSKYDGYFMWQGRPIWYYQKAMSDTVIITYVDETLKATEESDYLGRIEKNIEGYTKESFLDKQYDFGTIVIRTNFQKTAEEIHGLYKERGEIEQSFDFLKNLLEQDKSYMQNPQSFEAWAFINHLALLMNYKIYNLLRIKKKLKKYSIADLISHLKYIFKIKTNEMWLTSEISKNTIALLDELDVHIT